MRAHSDAPGTSARKGQFINAYTRPARLPAPPFAAEEPAVALLDKRGLVSFSSAAMGNLFNSSQEELAGRDVATLLPGLPLKPKTPAYNLAFAESWEHEATWQKLKGLSPNGDSILLEVSLKKLSMKTKQYILLVMRPAQEKFEPVHELNLLIESARTKKDAIMITDTQGVIHFVNAAFEETTAYSLAEIMGQPASMIKPDFLDPELHGRMWETLLAGNDFRTVFTNRRKTGEIFHEDCHIRPFIDRFGVTTHFVATSHGLSEALQTRLLRLQHEAYHDALTGLPNRNLFADRLKQSVARALRRDEKLALLFIDLDNFKAINDTHGHAAGDASLRATANSLSECVRSEDTVARLGGDEFAVILIDTHRPEDIERVARKILLSLMHGITFENQFIPIRASLGASIYPDHGCNVDTLLRQADSAMYKAKSTGGHCLQLFNAES